MRLTFRTFTWEWGFFVLLAVGAVLHVLAWVMPWWANAPLALVSLAYLVYFWRVTDRYPHRGDLPEWKAYMRVRNYCRREWRNNLKPE